MRLFRVPATICHPWIQQNQTERVPVKLKRYLSLLPAHQRARTTMRMQRVYSLGAVDDQGDGLYLVGVNRWCVELSTVIRDKSEFDVLAALLYRQFPAVCNCPDYLERPDSKVVPCKHIWAVIFLKFGWDAVEQQPRIGGA